MNTRRQLPSLLPLLPATMLLSCATAQACIGCANAQLRLHVPFVHPMLFILGTWRLVYLYHQVRSPTATANHRFWSPVIVLGGMALFGGVLGELYLMLFLLIGSARVQIYAWVRIMARVWKNQDDPLAAARTFPVVSNLIAVAILLPIAAYSIVSWERVQAWERVHHHIYPGMGVGRLYADQLVRDDMVSLMQVRGLLQQPSERDREWAFLILQARADASDLQALDETWLEPYFEDESFNYASNLMHRWLTALGAPQLDTFEDFQAWREGLADAAME